MRFLKVRRMCGGGYGGAPWLKLRRVPVGVIWDRGGWGLFWAGDVGPARRPQLVFRAGWPSRRDFRRFGYGWLRLGPWVLGNVAAWDRSDAP